MGTCKNFLVTFFDIAFSALVFILFVVILLPLLVVIFVPLYLWRLLLIGYVKLFCPDIVKIMGGKSPILAIDDIHNRPLCTIVGMGAFDTTDVQSCKQFAINSVYATDTSTNELLHPESQQYYEEWMGYMWWKQEENFDVNEHITIWNEGKQELLSEDDFIKIVGILEASPFPKKKSPWECVLVGNVMMKGVYNPEQPKTIVMFRFQHGFADGVAMLQLFMRCVFVDSFDKVVKPAYVERSSFQKRMYQLGAALQLPYQFFKQGVVAYDVNAWHVNEHKLTRKIHKAWSSRIPISLIKEIKLRHGVGFTAVLTAAISGAIRSMMIRSRVPVPDKMHAIVPLPWPGHPKKLRNHWSYGFLELPVGAADTNKRLQKTHDYIEKMKTSAIPAVNFYMLKFANLLPTWILRNCILTNYCPTVILSNFPGPPPNSAGLGFPLVDCMFTGGPLQGNIGVSVTILSYDGGIRIVGGVDSAILPTQNMTKDFVQLIENEFLTMKAIEAVCTV